MPSSYTLNNGIELIDTGEQSGTWGDTTNDNLSFIDTALDGQVRITASSAASSGSPNDLPITNGTASNGRNRLVEIYSGTNLGGTVYYQLTPNDAEKIIYIRNSLNTQDLIVFQGTYNASNDYLIPNGKTAVIFFNGTGSGAVAANVMSNAHFDALNIVGNAVVGGTLDVTSNLGVGGTVTATGTSVFASLDISGDIDVDGTTNLDVVDIDGAVDMASTLTVGGDISLTGATTISNTSGDLTLDVAGDLILDSDSPNWRFKDNGTSILEIGADSQNPVIYAAVADKDIQFKGNDGGSTITALTLDMSEGGAATFNAGVTLSGDLTVDTDTLYVDSANDRVGINTANPSSALEAVGGDGITISNSGDTFLQLKTTGSTATNYIEFKDSGGAAGSFSYNHTSNSLTTKVNGTSAMVIDSSRRVLIEATSTRTVDGYNQHMLLEGAGITKSSFAMVNHSNDANGAYFYLSKARGTTIGGSTIVQDGDVSGAVVFTAADGTDMASKVAQIQANVDGTPGANDMPGRLQFYTTADGATAVTERMRIDSSGNVGIGASPATAYKNALQVHGADGGGNIRITNDTTGTGTGNGFEAVVVGIDAYLIQREAAPLIFYTNNTEAMRIDSSQRLLIGHTSSIAIEGGNQNLQLIGTTSNDGLSIARFNADFGPYINFGRSGSGTIGTMTAVPNGDELGRMQWAVADGTDMSSVGASISAFTEQTAASNDVPSRLVFKTTSDGASSPTERMRIDQAGRVGIGGIDPSTFNGSANQLVISGSSNTGLTIDATSSTESNIFFADGADGTEAYRGIIRYHHSDDSFRFFTNGGSEAIRIDSSQRVLMGTGTDATSTITNGWWNGSTLYTGILNIQNVNDGSAQKYVSLAVSRHSNDVEAGQLGFAKSRGATANSKTTVGNGDSLGLVTFQGADGSNFVEAARILGATDGAAASDDMPGRLQFYTTSDGAASSTERMRIDSTGRTFAGDISYIGNATTNSVFEAHGGSVVFGSGDGSNNQGYRTFVKFLQVNNSSGLPTSATLELAGMTSEFYCKITVVGVNPYAGTNAFTYINESTGYAGGNFSVISANEYGAGTGISFGTATLVNTSGTLYSIQIPVTSSYTGYRFVVTAEIIGISNQNDPRFTYS